MTSVAHEPNASPAPRQALNIAFDTGFLALPPSGIGTYVAGLQDALQRRDDATVMPLAPPAMLRRLGDRTMRLTWDAAGVELVRVVRARNADVLHIPAFSAPVASTVPLVVTIHDVIPFVLPEYRASGAMRLYLELMRWTVRRARVVLTPSHAAAGDIERVLDIPSERIRVTPLAVDPGLRPAADREAVRAALAERFGIQGRYLLSIAGFDRRKNVPLLVRAFARALPVLPDDVVLVLAGAPHTDNPTVYPPVEPVIRDEAIGDRVVLTGRVTEDERRLLHQGAAGYVTPSVYEGFGLTPLEAMSCGVPVIAANRTSLPEVVGDAGVLVEPEVEEVAQAIVRLMTDPALCEVLARRGLERAAQFSWERTAELTIVAYREVANG